MKFFTKEWCLGRLSSIKTETVKSDYLNYINKIYHKLPVTLKLLTKNVYLHDGLIRTSLYDKNNNIFEISGIFGDLQFGYFFLNLRYSGVRLFNINELKEIFLDKKIEVLNDEIEILLNDMFSHRLIFNTMQEIEIVFSNLEIKINNEISKNYKKEMCIVTVLN